MAAMTGYNTTVQLDNASGVLTTLGDVKSITALPLSVGTVETTTLTSTSGYREYIGTLSGLGECSLTVNFDPLNATDVLVRAAVTDRVARTLKITFPDSSYQQAEVIVTGWEIGDVTPDGLMEATMTVQGTGVPSYA